VAVNRPQICLRSHPDKPNSLPVSDATRTLFDERMREYRANPAIGLPWASVHEHVLKMT
jgi:hypothetical protein